MGVYVSNILKHPKKTTKQSIKNYHQVFSKRKYDASYFKLQILKLEDLYKLEVAKFMHQFSQKINYHVDFVIIFRIPLIVTLILLAMLLVKIFLFLVSLLLKPKDPLNTSVQRSGMTFH